MCMCGADRVQEGRVGEEGKGQQLEEIGKRKKRPGWGACVSVYVYACPCEASQCEPPAPHSHATSS